MYCSLQKPKKYLARRLAKENQQISIINSDNNGSGRHHPQQMQQNPQNMYEGRLNTQVKTYTDNGNGHGGVIRAGSSSHYSKVSDSIILNIGVIM